MAQAVHAASLSKSYPQGDEELQVLKGVGFSVAEGEWVSIMGPSGSGKSTLLNLIGLLDRPTGGSLLLRGREVSGLNAKEAALARRENLGFIFQSFNLMPRMTAFGNVMLPMAIAGLPRAERKQRAQRLLESVGLGDRMHHRPNELSGGQRQRVAIARALALDPPILLADEPTGNLDTKTGAEVMALFGRLHAQGKTIIQVTHDEEIAHHAQRILRVRDGVMERIDHGRGHGGRGHVGGAHFSRAPAAAQAAPPTAPVAPAASARPPAHSAPVRPQPSEAHGEYPHPIRRRDP